VQPTSEERIPKTIEIKSITHGQHPGSGGEDWVVGPLPSTGLREPRPGKPGPLRGASP
jgi:hypothetical protein